MTGLRFMPRCAAVLAAGLTLAACTSSTKNATVNSASALPSAPSASASGPDTTSASPTSDTATATTSSSAPAPASTANVPERSTCTSLSIRVLRGSASAGQEIAALQFTNSGTSSCVLAGYPTVTLLAGAKQLGQPSQPSTGALSRRTLAPGAVAESRLHDYTSCQAPLSQSIKVVAPGSSISTIRPIALRACILRVDKLTAPQ